MDLRCCSHLVGLLMRMDHMRLVEQVSVTSVSPIPTPLTSKRGQVLKLLGKSSQSSSDLVRHCVRSIVQMRVSCKIIFWGLQTTIRKQRLTIRRMIFLFRSFLFLYSAMSAQDNELRCNNIHCRCMVAQQGKAVVTTCSRKLHVQSARKFGQSGDLKSVQISSVVSNTHPASCAFMLNEHASHLRQ